MKILSWKTWSVADCEQLQRRSAAFFEKNQKLSSHGRGTLLFVREDIPAKKLNTADFQGTFLELNLYKKKIIMLFL